MNRFGLMQALKTGALSATMGIGTTALVARSADDATVTTLMGLFWVIAVLLLGLVAYDEEVSQRANFE